MKRKIAVSIVLLCMFLAILEIRHEKKDSRIDCSFMYVFSHSFLGWHRFLFQQFCRTRLTC